MWSTSQGTLQECEVQAGLLGRSPFFIVCVCVCVCVCVLGVGGGGGGGGGRCCSLPPIKEGITSPKTLYELYQVLAII